MNPARVSSEEFRELSSRFPQQSVLVVGDVMLDEYIWGEAGRISPEAPVPIVEVERDSLRLGGAANVALNLASLGGQAEILSVVGEDSRADDLRHGLEARGIGSDTLIEDPERPTTLKTRIVASRQQVVRVDRESRAGLTGKLRERFLEKLHERLPRVAGVIVSDYGKGVIDLELMAELAEAARTKDVFVAVDPKESHFYQYKGVSIVTPNVHEASSATRMTIRTPESLEEAGRKLLSELDAQGVLITRGAEGMTLFRPDQPSSHIPATAREVFDVTGAGDTVIASLTLARVAGATLEQAAVISNAAASVVVGEIGTADVSVEDVEMALDVGFRVEPSR